MKILTFDIEEWFHILDNESTKTEKNWTTYEDRLIANVERIFKFLQRTENDATFFCLGWVAKKYPEIIKRIDKLGYEVGSHSHMHQLIYEQKRKEFENDLKNSINYIEDTTGKKVRAYRAPGFSIKEKSLWAFEVMIENGIEIDSSIFPSRRQHGGLKSSGITAPTLIQMNGGILKEFPINMYTFVLKKLAFSGGGYFRIFPFFFIKHLMKNSGYVMTYFHPRDFDAKQPIIKELKFFRKFKSYYGLEGALEKLYKIAGEFKLIDLREADSLVEWDRVKVIQIDQLSP
jgi:polysaccharide deacetylase family protein (PEP-CTERM system associated)